MSKNNKDFFKNKNDWSEIKDRLLGCYLPQYFQKVLMTRKPIFYVDCFAGKGKFDDGSDGSPLIALKVRDDCLQRTNVQNGRIDTCFIDLNYAKELAANVAGYCSPNGSPLVVSGKYEEEIEKILSSKKGTNIFLYIDPYGIRALDSDLFDKFSTYGFNSIELLINMNSFGFFRDACRVMSVDYQNDEALNNLEDIVEYEPTQIDASQQSEMLLNSIAGGEYWKSIVSDYKTRKIDGYEAEKRFSTEYKKHLRQKYTYVLDMPIRLKPGQRPKYRMIHISNHEHGCILMADNMATRSDELFIEVQQKGQMSLFDLDVENEIINESEIEDKIMAFLDRFPQGIGTDKLLACFFTEYGVLCKSGFIKKILKSMEGRGSIAVVRVPALTDKNNPCRTFTESKKQSVTIRRNKA